jgi:hypothetical protein
VNNELDTKQLNTQSSKGAFTPTKKAVIDYRMKIQRQQTKQSLAQLEKDLFQDNKKKPTVDP